MRIEGIIPEQLRTIAWHRWPLSLLPIFLHRPRPCCKPIAVPVYVGYYHQGACIKSIYIHIGAIKGMQDVVESDKSEIVREWVMLQNIPEVLAYRGFSLRFSLKFQVELLKLHATVLRRMAFKLRTSDSWFYRKSFRRSKMPILYLDFTLASWTLCHGRWSNRGNFTLFLTH